MSCSFGFLMILYNSISYVKVGLSRLTVLGAVLIYYICLEIIFFRFQMLFAKHYLTIKKKKFSSASLVPFPFGMT